MRDPVLKLHDKGPAVREAQDFLNRNGALLKLDGDFGQLTAAAVREFQTMFRLRATGRVTAANWKRLRALPEPSPDIPTQAVAFICREEVGSRELYESKYSKPAWPGLESGVTIGVGYDLGYHDNFAADWSGLLPPEHIATLSQWLGRKGQTAADGPAQLTNISIPWYAAWTAFIQRTLPQEIDATSRAFSPSAHIPRLCLGVLVSLVYNRGTSMTDLPGADRRQEMRKIRDAVAAGRLTEVPAALRSMKRLWPEGSGLRDRREREATLFEEGLQLVNGVRRPILGA